MWDYESMWLCISSGCMVAIKKILGLVELDKGGYGETFWSEAGHDSPQPHYCLMVGLVIP